MKEQVKVSESVKEIPGFSRYLIDIYEARVYRKPTDNKEGKWLKKIKPNDIGYCYTTLINDEGEYERISLHWLVVMAATESTKDFFTSKNLEVDHRFRDKSDNNFNRLKLVTKSQNHENIQDRKKPSRLSAEDVEFIREAFTYWEGRKIEFYKAMSAEFNVVWQTIQYTILGYNHTEEQL